MAFCRFPQIEPHRVGGRCQFRVRHMRLSGARVLPHHPATGRRRVVALARCRSRKPTSKLRQASLPRRESRSCCTSTALERRPSRRASSPNEADQTLYVRPSQLRLATLARCERRLNSKPTQGRRSPAHSSPNVRKNHFCSALDIYNTALTAAQVQGIYNAGNAGVCP